MAGIVHFGPFRLDSANARLWKGERACPLTPKGFAVLALLVARAGRLVAKEEALGAVWPDVVVSDAALSVCIREIRPPCTTTRASRGSSRRSIGAASVSSAA